MGKHPFDAAHDRAGLHRLPADIQLQVIGIDHALDETQIVRQQIFVVILDADLVRIEPQPEILAQPQHAPLQRGRDEEQARICTGTSVFTCTRSSGSAVS